MSVLFSNPRQKCLFRQVSRAVWKLVCEELFQKMRLKTISSEKARTSKVRVRFVIWTPKWAGFLWKKHQQQSRWLLPAWKWQKSKSASSRLTFRHTSQNGVKKTAKNQPCILRRTARSLSGAKRMKTQLGLKKETMTTRSLTVVRLNTPNLKKRRL